MDKKEMIILYGAGRRCRVLLRTISYYNMPIEVYVVDKNESRWGEIFEGVVIRNPEDIISGDCMCLLCITLYDSLETQKIRQKYINSTTIKEIGYYQFLLWMYEQSDFCNTLTKSDENTEESLIFSCPNGLVLGGIEEWTKGLSSEFLRRGKKNTFVLTDCSDYPVPQELANNIIRVDTNKDDYFTPRNVEAISIAIVEKLPCTVVTSKPDDVLMAAKLVKIAFPDQIRIISGIRGGSSDIYQAYYGMEMCTDEYVCVSSDIRKAMIEKGIAPNRIQTMLCPVTCPKLLDRSYSLDANTPILIGYAGRLIIEQKRMDYLLELISLLERNNNNYELHIAGDGPFKNEMLKFVEKNNLENKVIFEGLLSKDQVAEFWSRMDVCINLADYEGRSRSIIESMAQGAVPVVTNTSGVNDDIVHEKNGFVVDIGAYNDAYKWIQYLASNREVIKKMGTLAYEELKDKCSMEKHYKFWCDLLAKKRCNS